MSASTVAIANQAVNNSPSLAIAPRRRAITVTEKKTSNIEMVGEGGGGVGVSDPGSGGGGGIVVEGKDLSHTIKGELSIDRTRDYASLQARKGLINSTVSPRRRKVVPKSVEKPLWQTVLSVFGKNLMLLIALAVLVQMVRRLVVNSGDGTVSPMGISEVESRIAEVEGFLKTTVKMMQVQVEVVDKKIDSEVGGLRRMTKKVEEKGVMIENELKKLEAKTEDLGKSLGEIRSSGFFTKEDFEKFSDDLKKSVPDGKDKDWSLDEIRAFAKEIVEKEIEKHAADGLGMVDYALFSGGGRVVDHSEPYLSGKGAKWFPLGKNQMGNPSDAQKMLEPSFGEPGQCFPLKGSNGFVVVRLRTAILPEAVTLEHVAKSVAYDRSSAPKDCRISAWFQGRDSETSDQAEKLFLLAEFVYDLERSNAQTFSVKSADSGMVNVIRLDFSSNHGSPHTCIYRLRVHGREPDAVAISKLGS